MVKEIKVGDIEVESSILGMSVVSGSSSAFSITRAFNGKDNVRSRSIPSVGKAVKTNPQPKAFKSPIPKGTKPVRKKEMEIQKGLKISAPSPMSLDRVQVQMGQEKVVPESKEYQELQADEERQRLIAQQKLELERKKQEIKEEVKREVKKEQGEGFEAQLEDFTTDVQVGKKKSLVRKILGKIYSWQQCLPCELLIIPPCRPHQHN